MRIFAEEKNKEREGKDGERFPSRQKSCNEHVLNLKLQGNDSCSGARAKWLIP